MASGSERIIFALDFPDGPTALTWVERLKGEVGAFKVGLELFVAAGPELVRDIVAGGSKVFLDLKFHDIPNTMAGAAVSASAHGAFIINVHALAGADGMRAAGKAAREGAARAGLPAPKVIAVTILTSHSQGTLTEIGLESTPSQAVERLAALAREAELDGVVCSPMEAGAIRALWPDGLIVTPGVRPAGADVGDQTRIATPSGAISNGADYLVVGRPISGAADPVAAARAIGEEVSGALSARAKLS